MANRRGRGGEPPSTIALPALTAFGDSSLAPHGDYEALDLVDLDLRGQSAGDARFSECRMVRCCLDDLSAPRVRVADCLLEDVAASSLDLADSVWRDAVIGGGRFGALRAPGAAWTDVRIRGAKLNFVDLTGARLNEVAFDGCTIGELDLGDAQLQSVRFDGSTIEELNVAGARLSAVDISRAILRRVRGLESLRGATINGEQLADLAPLLAAHLGIEVRPD